MKKINNANHHAFRDFALSEDLNKSIKNMGFLQPTPIQAEAIPVALKGKDILGSAQTGSGKTAAFSIPIIERLKKDNKSMSVVLAPTRELAKQIYEVIRELLSYKNKIKVVSLIGGESINTQLSALKRSQRIIIGTPGRINDHLNRKSLSLKNTKILVLDETDRMLDMGFGVQIAEIVNHIPSDRQTLMFSATIPPDISKLADKYLISPKRISVGVENEIPENLKQEILKIKPSDKYSQLVNELKSRKGSVLVFMKTKYACDRMAKKLSFDDIKSVGIHGDLKQNKRNRIISDFRNNKFLILIATDIVCRGLDVPQIEHVINFDLPQVPEDFIHRIGRTARAGLSGNVLSFVTTNDHLKWRAIQKLLSPKEKSKILDISTNNLKNEEKKLEPRNKRITRRKSLKKKYNKNIQKKKIYEKPKSTNIKAKKRKLGLSKVDNRAKFLDEKLVYKIINEK